MDLYEGISSRIVKLFVLGKVNGLINLLTVNQHRLIGFCVIQNKIVVFIIHCLEYGPALSE